MMRVEIPCRLLAICLNALSIRDLKVNGFPPIQGHIRFGHVKRSGFPANFRWPIGVPAQGSESD